MVGGAGYAGDACRQRITGEFGEAFTHAAAHILRAAVLSNDWKALVKADQLRFEVGVPTLRFYDLIVLLHQSEILSEKECDLIRKSLLTLGDSCHSAFANRKFTEGLSYFYPRLILSGLSPLGSEQMTELGDEGRVELRKMAI